MLRELAITFYLVVTQVVFNFFKLFPQKEKSTFVASFGGNILYTIRKLEEQTDARIIVLKTPKCRTNYKENTSRTVLGFESGNLLHWFISIYHLATSNTIFVDNYYGFLAVANFKPDTTCIQVWHAAGAIKQFGLKDLTIENRPKRAYNRFKKVYQSFDHVVVGSEKMVTIFEEGFGLSSDQFLRTGVPRTDFFFNEGRKKEVETSLKKEFPVINQKKVILYAPTYRDNDLTNTSLKLDIEKMYHELKYEYVLFLRLHPAINGVFENKYPGFVYNVTGYSSVNHLLTITDILISDYSSIPFEFSLLNKPMVFYAYDIDDYSITRGFWENFEELVPGLVVETTSALIEVIKDEIFDLDKVKLFAEEWNEYSKGTSSEDLIHAIYGSTTDSQDNKYRVHP